MTQANETGHVGYVAIIGRPNVGKSTLLNQILGEKLAIVSPRPQTTRNRILGFKTWREQGRTNQMVLVDTPGLHQRRANLNKFMVQQALDSLDGVDVVLLMTEAAQKPRLHPADSFVLEQLRLHGGETPIVLVLNKIDRLKDRRPLLPLMAAWAERGFQCIVPLSARTGEGVEPLIAELVDRLPLGPLLYPEDLLTDQPERFLAAELIREQVYLLCQQEIPYATAVEVQRYEERRKGDVCIEAVIHVEQEGQKAILIGKGGSMIRTIGTAARLEIAAMLDCPVHLGLTIHVETDWSRRPAGRRKLGYES